ncbi:hypothetical protein BC835DRAFT_1417985 [Cytidiella melzeri]|nr:hypothetical protein BC835DRAFT_1417985 [Cytidiella melzeri]
MDAHQYLQLDFEADVAYTEHQDNDLYLERLETLYEKHLGEINAFAKRESRPCEDVRRSIAQWYSRTLFDLSSSAQQSQDFSGKLSTTMRAVSDALESLHFVVGYQSFFLIVNPKDDGDQGFLGGTILGREFWRGHRGCGAAGAQAFKLFCQKAGASSISGHMQPSTTVQNMQSVVIPQPVNLPTANSTAPKKGAASSVKAEVYASVRNAIRTTTGLRNAEMKWSNHDKLDVYGIRLEGWPPGVPKQNPSTLSTTQNRAILESLNSGRMTFVPINPLRNTPGPIDSSGIEDANSRTQDERDIFEDAVDFSAGLGEEVEISEDVIAASRGHFMIGSSRGIAQELLDPSRQQQSHTIMSMTTPPSPTAREGVLFSSKDEPVAEPWPSDSMDHEDADTSTRKRRRVEGVDRNIA